MARLMAEACAAASMSSEQWREFAEPMLALQRAGDQPVRQDGVLRQKRAVKIAADGVPVDRALCPVATVVAVPDADSPHR